MYTYVYTRTSKSTHNFRKKAHYVYVCHTFGNISVLPEVRKYFRTTNVAGLLPEVMGLYGSASLLPDLLTVLQSF